ncbi:MAG: hypothetical protein AAGA72_06945 [Pseudomonadota bacterium]
MSFSPRLGLSSSLIAAMLSAPQTAHAFNVDRPSFEVPAMVIVWAVDDSAPGDGIKVVDYMAEASDGTFTDLIAADGRTLLTGTLDPTNDFAAGPDTPLGRFRLRDLGDGSTTIVDPSQGSIFTAFDAENAVFDHYREDIDSSNTMYSSQFGVASNTGFKIQATVEEIYATGEFDVRDIKAKLRTHSSANVNGTLIGQKSTNVGVTLFPNATWRHLEYHENSDIVTMNRATATAPGTILEQSILINPRYLIDTSDTLLWGNDGDTHANSLDLSLGAGEIQATVTYTVYAL